MEPQEIKDLLEVGGFKKFLAALAKKAASLKDYGSFSGVDLDSIHDPVAYTVESKARKRAYDILEGVVLDVLSVDTRQPQSTKLSDYVA